MTKADKKEIKLAYELLNKIAKGYGTKMCKDYAPQCANCQAQILQGLLESHIDNIKG